MLKQIIALIVLSILVVLAMPYVQHAVQALASAHDWISNQLTEIFSGGTAGDITRRLIAILAIPLVIGLLPALIYWIAKRQWFPYFMHVVWVIWLLQTAAIVVLYKTT